MAGLSPYTVGHVVRFGSYSLDLSRELMPLASDAPILEAAWSEGEALPLEEAITLALEDHPHVDDSAGRPCVCYHPARAADGPNTSGGASRYRLAPLL